MSLVLDASLTLSWYFEDERTPAADQALDRIVASGAIVPPLWRLEVANGLQTAVRRNRCDASFRDRALAALSCLPISIDNDGDAFTWTTTLHLAGQFRLSVYDACYLELAQRLRRALGTLDQPLAAAAAALKLEVFGAGG